MELVEISGIKRGNIWKRN